MKQCQVQIAGDGPRDGIRVTHPITAQKWIRVKRVIVRGFKVWTQHQEVNTYPVISRSEPFLVFLRWLAVTGNWPACPPASTWIPVTAIDAERLERSLPTTGVIAVSDESESRDSDTELSRLNNPITEFFCLGLAIPPGLEWVLFWGCITVMENVNGRWEFEKVVDWCKKRWDARQVRQAKNGWNKSTETEGEKKKKKIKVLVSKHHA